MTKTKIKTETCTITRRRIVPALPVLLAMLVLFVLPTACRHQPAPTSALQYYNADTLMRIDRSAHRSPQAAEEALQKLRELRQKGEGPLFKLEWVEGNILLLQQKHLQAAEAYRIALATDSVQNNAQYYFNLCKNIMLLYQQRERMDSVMHYADLLLRRAERDGLPERAKQEAYWCMSRVYASYGDTLNRNETARQATQLAWQTLADRQARKAHIALALNKLFDIYSQTFGQALREGNINAADTLAARMQSITAGLDTLVLSPQRPDGVPQWNLQQTHGLLCRQMAQLCNATGRTAQERQWIERLKACAPGSGNDAYLAEHYLQTRHYDDALPLLLGIRQQYIQAEDSISSGNVKVCRQLSEACQALGRPTEALLWQRHSEVLQDSINARTNRSDAIQLAAISHTREQRLQIHNQQTTISRLHRNLILLALLALIVCIIATAIYLYLRRMKYRNIEMARQIKHQQKLNNELQQILESTRRLEVEVEEGKKAALYSPRTNNELPQWLKEKEETLNRQYALQKHFNTLQALMQEEKLYLTPDLKAEDVYSRLNITNNELNAATQEMVQLSFNDYVNRLRLEHALFLLESSEYAKIAVVAEESGFGSARHFYRLFQKEYDMSPTDYRNAMKGIQEKA